LPPGIFQEAEHAASRAEVFLVVGTSAVVYPAASLVPYARRAGAKVLEVNLEETPVSAMCDWSLRGKASELLPALLPEV
jgi:NAD-dependent deacetylase